MKKSTFRKALILLALMIAVAIPAAALTGSGTSDDPYMVTSADDLLEIGNYPSAYFQQDGNIVINDANLFKSDANGVITEANGAVDWTPVDFSGTYNGGGYYITGLYVTSNNANGGLFGTLTDANVINLKLDFALVESDEYAGIVAAKAEGATAISDVAVSGSVIGKTTKTMNTVGGVVGLLGKGASINDTASYADVTGATSYSANVGGIAGVNYGAVTASGFGGNVYGTATYYDAAIGGVVGYNAGSVKNCRVGNMAKVGGESTALVNDCFVGGVVGLNKGTVEYNVNESEVTAKNYSSGDSIVAAGGIVGATIDAGVSESKNSGSVFGEYVYAGGVAGVAVSDSGAYIVEKCDNDGEVSSGYGVAGGIVGRAVAAGEGYVTIKLSVVDCNNTGALSGNATGEVSGETATVESAQVVLGEEVSAYAGTCSSKTLSVITAASEQYGANIQATGEGSMSKLQIGSTDKYIVRFNGEGGIFAPRPVIVTWTMVTDTGAVEIVSVDASGLTLADGTLSGELKFKVYTPDTLAAATSVVGVSVGNQFVLADFVGVDTSKRCVEYTANISAATTAAGTINVNVHVVDTTDAMNPLCDKKTASK